MIKLFFQFFLITLIFQNSSFGNLVPYCNNKIPNNLLEKIDKTKPELIEIKLDNYRKWAKNSFKIKTSKSLLIPNKYKKKFNATIDVIFENNIKCSFKGKIRQHGDVSFDHLQFINGEFVSSLDVKLIDGHINGIVEFKLLMPNSRSKMNDKSGNDELILTELLRYFNFIAPRTKFIETKVNTNKKINMLFQEKAEKELLEYHLKREGPILEGDERFLNGSYDHLSINKAENIQLSRQVNSNWALKGDNYKKISFDALTKLNKAYLLYINQSDFVGLRISDYKFYNLNKNILSNYNTDQLNQLYKYEAILLSNVAQHALRPVNRKFYWNSINNYFEPIYYDGWGGSPDDNVLNINFPNNDLFLKAIIETKKDIKKIDINSFYKKIKESGSSLKITDLKERIDLIIKNLNKLEKLSLKNNQNVKIQRIKVSEKVWNNYLNSVKKMDFPINLIFTNISKKKILICNNSSLKCVEEKLSDMEISKLLKSNLQKNNKVYQFVGSYNGLEDKLNFKKIYDNNSYLKKNIFSINKTKFYYDNGISFDFNKEDLVFNIYQNEPYARSYFKNGKLENIKINFFGYSKNKVNKSKLFEIDTIDENGITGCLSLINLKVENIIIRSSDSDCEDSINFINTKGHIKMININNSKYDALDIDFSKIKVDNTIINNAKNDCIDLSSGNYEFNIINISNCEDKGISVGEKSSAKFNSVKILNTNIGISSKDSSKIMVDFLEFQDGKICIEAKRKKQEFSGSISYFKNYNCNGFAIKKFPGSFINNS